MDKEGGKTCFDYKHESKSDATLASFVSMKRRPPRRRTLRWTSQEARSCTTLAAIKALQLGNSSQIQKLFVIITRILNRFWHRRISMKRHVISRSIGCGSYVPDSLSRMCTFIFIPSTFISRRRYEKVPFILSGYPLFLIFITNIIKII